MFSVKFGRGSIWIYISFLRVHACVHSLFLCFCVICTIRDANLSLLLTRLSDFRSVLMFQFGQLYERKTVIDCPKQLQKREGVSLQILFTQGLISDLTLPECTLDQLQLCFAKNYSHAETLQKTQRISNKCYFWMRSRVVGIMVSMLFCFKLKSYSSQKSLENPTFTPCKHSLKRNPYQNSFYLL